MMKRKVLRVYLGLIALMGLLLLVQISYFNGITGFIIWGSSGNDFDSGSYDGTTYNGSAIVLDGENMTGNYTSKIFDANRSSDWNNISWSHTGGGNIVFFVRSCDDSNCTGDD